MSTKAKAPAKTQPLSDGGKLLYYRSKMNLSDNIRSEIQQTYTRFQGDLQALAQKIGELESEAEEHEYANLIPFRYHEYLTELDLCYRRSPSRSKLPRTESAFV